VQTAGGRLTRISKKTVDDLGVYAMADANETRTLTERNAMSTRQIRIAVSLCIRCQVRSADRGPHPLAPLEEAIGAGIAAGQATGSARKKAAGKRTI
jgi:hypothetical protein